MAKVVITLEDTANENISVIFDFTPKLDLTEDGELTQAQMIAGFLMEQLGKAGTVSNPVANGEPVDVSK